jgi:hypothetical protein
MSDNPQADLHAELLSLMAELEKVLDDPKTAKKTVELITRVRLVVGAAKLRIDAAETQIGNLTAKVNAHVQEILALEEEMQASVKTFWQKVKAVFTHFAF